MSVANIDFRIVRPNHDSVVVRLHVVATKAATEAAEEVDSVMEVVVATAVEVHQVTWVEAEVEVVRSLLPT